MSLMAAVARRLLKGQGRPAAVLADRPVPGKLEITAATPEKLGINKIVAQLSFAPNLRP
jgi:hypothetical protein